MRGWSVERRIGRLVEGRVITFDGGGDVMAYSDEFRRVVNDIGRDALVCVDYRQVSVFAPAAADELRELMLDVNSRVLRSAILLASSHATHALQVERVMREAPGAKRRRFVNETELLAWMREVTDPGEQHRLQVFLAEGNAAMAPT
jgi:hypothetical protein